MKMRRDRSPPGDVLHDAVDVLRLVVPHLAWLHVVLRHLRPSAAVGDVGDYGRTPPHSQSHPSAHMSKQMVSFSATSKKWRRRLWESRGTSGRTEHHSIPPHPYPNEARDPSSDASNDIVSSNATSVTLYHM